MHEKNFAIIFAVLIASAFALRLFLIDVRPAHHDEGVNGHFVAQVLSFNKNGYDECMQQTNIWPLCAILNSNSWKYDATNYHGPLPFYLMAIPVALFGENIVALRLMPALFGVLTALIVLLFRKHLGNAGTLAACFLILFSPAFFYYSLDAIHEIFFAFFAFASLGFLLSYVENFDRKNLYAGVAMLACLFTTKEGSFLVGPAIAIIALILLILKFMDEKREIEAMRIAKTISICMLIFLAIFVVLFSSLFTNMQGVYDAFSSPFIWGSRMSAGAGHEKHPFYYLEIMLFSELVLLVLGILGIATALIKKNPAMTALAAFFLLFIIGASVPAYKVPWGIIACLPVLAVLAGYFVENASEKIKTPVFYFALALMLTFVFWQALWLSTVKCESQENKLSYVQTTFEAKRVIEKIEAMDKEKYVRVAIIMKQSSWPLPWQLKRYSLSYPDADSPSMIDISSYDVVLAERAYINKLSGTENFEMQRFALRPKLEMVAFFRR